MMASISISTTRSGWMMVLLPTRVPAGRMEEDFSQLGGDGVEVGDVGDEDAVADDVAEGGARFRQCLLHHAQDVPGLRRGVAGGHWRAILEGCRAGDRDVIANAHGAAVAVFRLEWSARADQLSPCRHDRLLRPPSPALLPNQPTAAIVPVRDQGGHWADCLRDSGTDTAQGPGL